MLTAIVVLNLNVRSCAAAADVKARVGAVRAKEGERLEPRVPGHLESLQDLSGRECVWKEE